MIVKISSLWLLLCTALLAPTLLLAGDLQVSCERKKMDTTHGKAKEGDVAKTSEEVIYTIGLTNNANADMGSLDIKYIVFVERQKVGRKRGTETTEPIKGAAKVEGVVSRKKSEVDTDPVSLKTEALQGNFIYADGGRMKAQDSVKGVWIRVFDGPKMVAEFANPPTVSKREKWVE